MSRAIVCDQCGHVGEDSSMWYGLEWEGPTTYTSSWPKDFCSMSCLAMFARAEMMDREKKAP